MLSPPSRHGVILGNLDADAVGIDIDRSGGIAVVGDHLHRDPAAGIARGGPAVEAVVEELLDVRRIEDRDAVVHEGIFGLMRGGRGLGGVVVTGENQDAAMLGRAGEVAVAEHVAAAVDARALAVPHAEDAVVLVVAEQVELLGAPDGGGGEVFVDPRLELDLVLVEVLPGGRHGQVEPAQGRAAIAGDVAGGVEPGRRVALALHDRQAGQRLHAIEVNPALVCGVFVVQRDGRQARSLRHVCFSQSGPSRRF